LSRVLGNGTSAIIGPSTMQQLDSPLPAADVELDAVLLDRIDEIVRTGVNLNPADTSYGEQCSTPALADASPERSGLAEHPTNQR
jgi:hypothetical protein